MQSTVLLFLAILGACACAGVYKRPHYTDKDDDLYENVAFAAWESTHGKGQVINWDGSVWGRVKREYNQDIFNDQLDHLQGQKYGPIVLSDDGDSSMLRDKLDWANSNDNARDAQDGHKEIGDLSDMTLSGDGVSMES